MKKIIISMMLALVAVTASAQIKTVDIKGSLRSDFGLGIGITGDLSNKIEFSPSFNYYFIEDCTCFQLEADFHYNIPLGSGFKFYPIVGIGLDYAKPKECDGETNLLVNLGAGINYKFSSNVTGFVEGKYQWIDGGDDSYFSLGIKLGI